ncbi:murein biosynthesis integral membrane protein MurJ [Demetria terragena]|uniref:murein biosynthesis integral membrane protein MurJ n=1 Tax=Demetria terragena TaxID=63959 RepID=UPI000382B481|nr:lipid II flippase MurJ [Demetria terragena]
MSGSGSGRGQQIVAAVGLIAVATLASRIVGFGRWLVFSATVGGTCVGETYATVNQLPNVLFEVAAGGALAAVVIPLVGRALAQRDRVRADHIASALLTWALALLLPLAVLLGLLAQPLTSALLGDNCSSGARDDLAVRMLLVFAPQVPLYAVGIILGAVLQAHRRFLAAAIVPLLSSAVVIVAYLTYGVLADASGEPGSLSTGAEIALTGGTTLGVVAMSLPLLWPIRRAGVRLRPTWAFPPGEAARARQLAGAGMLALMAQQGAVLATIWVANHGGSVGALNVYTYVQAVYLLPYAVLAVPIATAAFPSMVGADDLDPAPGRVLTAALRGVLVAGGVGAAVLVAAAPAIGDFFLYLDVGRDTGGASSLAAMGSTVTAYAVGLLGFAVAALLQRALYARGRSWTTGAAVAVGWLIAAVMPLLLVRSQIGSADALRILGWSSSAGMFVSAGVLAVLVGRVWGRTVIKEASRTWITVLVAALVSGVVGRLVASTMPTDGLGSAAGAGILGGVVTLVLFVGILWLGDRSALRLAWTRKVA